MRAPMILGVEGEPQGTSGIAWRIGPWRAVVVDRAALRLGSGVAGMLNIDTDGQGLRSVGVLRLERDTVDEVAAALESWLRQTLAETVGALGLALWGRDSAPRAEALRHRFRSIDDAGGPAQRRAHAFAALAKDAIAFAGEAEARANDLLSLRQS